jgi:hypothetical protein
VRGAVNSDQLGAVKKQILSVLDDAFQHDGFSEFKVEIKILKRQQKEIIVHYGKQHRYVLDYLNSSKPSQSTKNLSPRKLAGIES